MKSTTTPLFRASLKNLSPEIKLQAKKAYRLWRENPFHPSLHFKCVDTVDNVWSVRINLNYRAMGMVNNTRCLWFWIGTHSEYDKILRK